MKRETKTTYKPFGNSVSYSHYQGNYGNENSTIELNELDDLFCKQGKIGLGVLPTGCSTKPMPKEITPLSWNSLSFLKYGRPVSSHKALTAEGSERSMCKEGSLLKKKFLKIGYKSLTHVNLLS